MSRFEKFQWIIWVVMVVVSLWVLVPTLCGLKLPIEPTPTPTPTTEIIYDEPSWNWSTTPDTTEQQQEIDPICAVFGKHFWACQYAAGNR